MERPARIEPGPGQESVWDYPRPPAVVPSAEHVVVMLGGLVVADTRRALRVLETSQPPAYYLPMADIADGVLTPSDRTTFCEWKGPARYYDVRAGATVALAAAWTYPQPTPRFEALVDHVAFYAQAMERCTVDGEVVQPNEGSFYGGWVTSKVVGPFKGAAGTLHW
ncbi:MAG: DUF427 domain-containing protein [Actinomycetota bacterium]|nr:DUF427 domain-containing protein [Actinomycetota bacterium]